MADGNIPDQTQALLALQQYTAQQSAGGKPSRLFCMIDMDWNASGGLSLQASSPFGKNIPSLFGSKGKQGMADKFFAAIQAIPEDLKKRAAEAGVMYSGAVTNGPPTPGISGEGGSSFTSMVGGSRGGNIEIA